VFADLYESEPRRREAVGVDATVPASEGIIRTRGALVDFFNAHLTTWVETEVPLAVILGAAALKNAWPGFTSAQTVRQAVVDVPELHSDGPLDPSQLKYCLTLVAVSETTRAILLDGYHCQWLAVSA
jgi:hypothetical protein